MVSYKELYAYLDENSDRLQLMADDYLWHRSHPLCYLKVGDNSGEFFDANDDPTNEFHLHADRMVGREPAYGDGFWLVPKDDGSYSADSYSDTEPEHEDAVYVPWRHIVQHIYEYFTDFDIKEAHTFWPYGTTEQEVLELLANALNNDDYNASAPARVQRDDDSEIKTFYIDVPDDPQDKYDAEQMSDLIDILTAAD